MEKKYNSTRREWRFPDCGANLPGILAARPAPPDVSLAIILDILADDLSIELDGIETEHGIECPGIWAIIDQMYEYSKWARGLE